MNHRRLIGGIAVLSLALAVLIAQIAPDGYHIKRDAPPDLVTWRWFEHEGKATLGWGFVDAAGRFKAVRPHPPYPILPDPPPVAEKPPTAEPDPTDVGGPDPPGRPTVGAKLPAFATNGGIASKLAADGLTLRASDADTAAEAAKTLFEAKANADPADNCPDPPEKIQLPTPSIRVGPDAGEVAMYGVAIMLFAAAGWIFSRSVRK